MVKILQENIYLNLFENNLNNKKETRQASITTGK